MIRLSTNSSNEDIFTQNKQDYEIALKIVDIKKNSYKSREDNKNIRNKKNNNNTKRNHKNKKRIFLNIRKKFS